MRRTENRKGKKGGKEVKESRIETGEAERMEEGCEEGKETKR